MEEEDCSSEVDPLLITDPLEVDVNQLVKLEPEIESEDDASLENYEDPDYILEEEPELGDPDPPGRHRNGKLKTTYACCSLIFRTKAQLENHKTSQHTQQCQKCDAWVKDLRNHIKRVHHKKRHICSICDKGFTYPRELKAHEAKDHNDVITEDRELVACNVCDKMIQKKGLEKHRERLHTKKVFSCLFCNFTANTRMGVVRHTDKKHEKLSVVCPICTREVFNLEEHVARHGKMKYGCSSCAFKAGLKAEVEDHYRSIHLSDSGDNMLPENYAEFLKPSPSHFRVVRCDHCSYSSNSLGNVRKHTKTVHEHQKEKCDICDGWFKSAQAHKRSVHEKVRNYPCTFCDYKSINNYQLNNHIRVKHTDIDERQPCKLCGKKVKDLNKHNDLNHSSDPSIKEPKHFCEYCPYKTHDKSAYSAHIKARHIRNRIECKICHKMVIQVKLSGHMKCHKDNRFSCIPCTRTFRERRDLGKHILYQHRHHRHRCEMCKSNNVTDYLAHMKYNHKDVDWRTMVIPNSDKLILSLIVKWLDEVFVYYGDQDTIEEKLAPVLQVLKTKGVVELSDVKELGYSFLVKEENHLESAESNDSNNSGLPTEVGSQSVKKELKEMTGEGIDRLGEGMDRVEAEVVTIKNELTDLDSEIV